MCSDARSRGQSCHCANLLIMLILRDKNSVLIICIIVVAVFFVQGSRSAGACRHGSSSVASWVSSFIRLVRLLLLLVLELQRWPGVCSCGLLHRSRGRLPCIIMEEQEAVVSLVLSGHNVFFQGPAGSPSVSLRSCGRSARSIAADDDGKTFAAAFCHYHWTGLRICHAHRSPSARERRSK